MFTTEEKKQCTQILMLRFVYYLLLMTLRFIDDTTTNGWKRGTSILNIIYTSMSKDQCKTWMMKSNRNMVCEVNTQQ